MRGKPKVLALPVNTRIHNIIIKENKKLKIPMRYQRRLQIILDGISGKSIYRSSKDLSVREETVRLWRDRWKEHIAGLLEASEEGIGAKSLKDYELVKMLKAILNDKQRKGRPKQITVEQEEQIRAIACTSPLDHGIQMTRWTHSMLADTVISKKIVNQISARYIGVILKKTS